MLDSGLARSRPISRFLSSPRFRDWFYYRGRRPTAELLRGLQSGNQIIIAIGDAVRPGKSKEAIANAFETALLAHDSSTLLERDTSRIIA
jgi:hypothetical protein